jgi:ubiquinone/menaquinone biosynthesis C-methylase UbiE
MIEVARENARQAGVRNIEFRLMDGEEIEAEPASFDAVTCRWGIMFMPEPVRFLQRAAEALKPGGKVAIAVWGPPQNNPFISLPMLIARKYYQGPPMPDPTAPGGVFSLADKERLRSVLEEAGFSAIQIEEMVLPMSVFDSGEEFFEFIREMTGPLQRMLKTLPADTQAEIGREIIAAAPQGNPDGRVSLNGNPIIAGATK